MLRRLRFWLIVLLAGRDGVAVNLTFGGKLTLPPHGGSYLHRCTFESGSELHT